MAIWVKPNGNEIEINDQNGNLKAAISLGWKLKEDLVNDAEKGNGQPGTAEWHITAVKGMSSAQEVQDYMVELGIDMNASGNLRAVKRSAVQLIKEARQ